MTPPTVALLYRTLNDDLRWSVYFDYIILLPLRHLGRRDKIGEKAEKKGGFW